MRKDSSRRYQFVHASLREGLESEINRFSSCLSEIDAQKITRTGYLIFFVAILVDFLGFMLYYERFMLIWISSSLYLYLFYPILPLILFPIRQLQGKAPSRIPKAPLKSRIDWMKNLHIIRNRKVGFRLAFRFFILSILPLTIGMVSIYTISVIYSLYLGFSEVIPFQTSLLILVQCLGIILFYIEIFFFRDDIARLTRFVLQRSRMTWQKVLIIGISGALFLVVGTIAVIILLVAILLPSFTLTHFINVSEFVMIRSDIWVLPVLLSQMVIMQFLQSVLSRSISRDMCTGILQKLLLTRERMGCPGFVWIRKGREKRPVHSRYRIRETVQVIREANLYMFSKRDLACLFPAYSIGVNIPFLFSVQDLGELKEIFSG